MSLTADPIPAQKIGENLARLRHARGLTLDGLAEISLVSRAAISALEQGNGNPRLQTIWSLADALGVNFGALLGNEGEEGFAGEDGINIRLLERQRSPRVVEAYLLDLPPHASRRAKAHVPGVREHIVVISGEMQAGPDDAPSILRCGQSVTFAADVPHLYTAGDVPCKAIVTVVYPDLGPANARSDHDLVWPHTQAEWQAISAILARAGIEVQNGLGVNRATFHEAAPDQKAAHHALTSFLGGLPASPVVRRYISLQTMPSVVTLYRTPQLSSLGARPAPLDSDLGRRCWQLAQQALGTVSDPETLDGLTARATQPGAIIEAALAAEVLTRNGRPTIPFGVGEQQHTAQPVTDEDAPRLFETRIDVDAYEAFELVHPAYARQTLAVAAALPVLPAGSTANLLDIGTGPGLPLAMLRELRPDIRALAVDPSHVAVTHLRKRFQGDDAVEILQQSVTDLAPPDQPFTCAVSIGASHHLDTAAFLSAVRRQMATGGQFVVADEMIAPFTSREERQSRLIRHHLWYILDTLVSLPPQAGKADVALSGIIRNKLPLAAALAHAGDARSAMQMVRETFEEVRELALPCITNHNLAVFARFHLLELQALVAGLDYEVEQKTSPARFIAMSAACGFSLNRHARIYATDGDDPLDGGTHLFVLEAV